MEITVLSEHLDKIKVDLLVVPIDDSLKVNGNLPASVKKELESHIKKVEFTGEWGSAEVVLLKNDAGISLAALAGLGGQGKDRAEGLRRAWGRILKDSKKYLLRKIAVDLTGSAPSELLAKATVEAVLLSEYRFSEYSARLKKEQKQRSMQEIVLLTNKDDLSAVRKAVKQSRDIMSGVELTRELVNQPAANMSPRHLVRTAKKIKAGSSKFSLKILDKKKAAKEGFSAFLAVAKGSEEEPYVIHLTYKPAKKVKKKQVLVGKGITFDSGGLSLKPAEYMEAMKMDMAGAATVLGVMSVLPDLDIDTEVHAIIPACENMPSGTAYRPGDILTAKNGKTIEVLNTDAEGRIILADALSYAVQLKPDAMVDLATLTGACMVALGETYAGLFSNNNELRDELLQSAGSTGEGLTALPLPEEYRPFIESKVADVRNMSTSRYGGAITAAMFLENFVDDVPWAHLDIAGPSFMERDCLPYYGYGATGYGVRTLVRWLMQKS